MQPAETHTVGGNRGEEPEQKYEEVSSMKKRGYVEMRYYDVPQKEWVLALLGQEWVRAYGEASGIFIFTICSSSESAERGQGCLSWTEKTARTIRE